MAFSGSQGRSHRGRGRFRASAEINVTPLVDVMLVLLVIFMITAPLLTVGVPVDLPKTQASPLQEKDEPLTVTVNQKGEVFLQETPITLETLVPRLIVITQTNPEARILVRGDKGVPYGKVMEVMGAINAAGFTKVALLSEVPTIDKPSPSTSNLPKVKK